MMLPDDLVKLLAVSMRNDFDKEISFEQLAEQKIDAIITREDGSQVPANTFFYEYLMILVLLKMNLINILEMELGEI